MSFKLDVQVALIGTNLTFKFPNLISIVYVLHKIYSSISVRLCHDKVLTYQNLFWLKSWIMSNVL